MRVIYDLRRTIYDLQPFVHPSSHAFIRSFVLHCALLAL